MRHLLTTTTAFTLLATICPADTLNGTAAITGVTLYPWGATVTRNVTFDAPPGQHEVVIPGLPAGTDPNQLRVAAEADLRLGAVTLAQGRLPVADQPESAAVTEARAEIDRLEDALASHSREIAIIRTEITAADERVAFLKSLATGEDAVATLATSLDNLRALTKLVGDEVLAARQEALAAQARIDEKRKAREEIEKALADARQALAALIEDDRDGAVLTIAVSSPGGTGSLEVSSFTDLARWSPVYDLRLTTDGTPSLEIDRGVTVSQASGEDWRGVALTLSTARPISQSAPSQLNPLLRQIRPEEQIRPQAGLMSLSDQAESRMTALEAAPAPMAEPVFQPKVARQGANVTYSYPGTVDLRNGVEDLRLPLDTLDLSPALSALAVPRRDSTAFLMAEVTNTTGEILLAGGATLYRDGAMVGRSYIEQLAEGADADLPFGAIDGLQLSRIVPERSEGERGLLTSSNGMVEVAILKIENLTDRSWPIRVLDQVAYSEQDALEIDWSAAPRPTETDVDGLRGVLAWEFEIAAEQTREIRLEQQLEWPEGQVLR